MVMEIFAAEFRLPRLPRDLDLELACQRPFLGLHAGFFRATVFAIQCPFVLDSRWLSALASGPVVLWMLETLSGLL